ncbi:hypothetical protein TREMEDRAFT_45482 [Tremella mesenterica DSM 1558]|uniref:uncharacterized protein n=1 Tax=Tremella mesenterica (strain ATCC 24925 / CBS 8224 / DSM 1558 / NBRC 9311 / NRRL Y-6157 / RJB 2259-6 / UBC 559-6) TaxID=578456 RepID=UPI0003F4A420|nr:uncharacterized protein TREMEDRAFT_45482 [Tremella mesenterica DSM 1558]EIW67045.1 hypothetical protein TREMEDRAFT_45482 [Tremella mesenterica DSM 1558]
MNHQNGFYPDPDLQHSSSISSSSSPDPDPGPSYQIQPSYPTSIRDIGTNDERGTVIDGGTGVMGNLVFQDLHAFLEMFWARWTEEMERDEPDFRVYNLPLARIKKVMKSDEEVKMISAEVPVMFAKACEVFISELTGRAWLIAESNKRRTLQKSDVAAAIAHSDMFDFLIDIVPRDDNDITSHPPPPPPPPPPQQQQQQQNTLHEPISPTLISGPSGNSFNHPHDHNFITSPDILPDGKRVKSNMDDHAERENIGGSLDGNDKVRLNGGKYINGDQTHGHGNGYEYEYEYRTQRVDGHGEDGVDMGGLNGGNRIRVNGYISQDDDEEIEGDALYNQFVSQVSDG